MSLRFNGGAGAITCDYCNIITKEPADEVDHDPAGDCCTSLRCQERHVLGLVEEPRYNDMPDADLDENVVEKVAMAMVNADNDSFGKAWPWPGKVDEPWAIEVREDAKKVARIAIRAYERSRRGS